MAAHIVSVWVGEKYGPEYVLHLHDMVARNASRAPDLTHWCVTDRPAELPEGITPIRARADLPGWWQKVALFSPYMPWKEGERVAFFDLDVAITGRLEDLLETPGIIRDQLWPCFNSSVMVWDYGEHREIWDRFTVDVMTRPGRVVPAECLPMGQINGGDQEWITEADRTAKSAPWRVFPAEWSTSYREGALAWPPDGCKVVYFNGQPKPHEIADGWVPNVWKVGGFTSLPTLDGVNVSYDALYANVRANVLRDLPWLGQAPDHSGVAVLVAGGPSMKTSLREIRERGRKGATIVTVNNALGFLRSKHITPDCHVMVDARPENADFVRDAPEATTYFIASQCHPEVFDALEGRRVVVWHNGFGDNEGLREILQPWWDDGPNAKPIILVPGGGTVGLRALWLLAYQGYREIHIYGMDSSYAGSDHHAYAQPLNDADPSIEVAVQDPGAGRVKRYRCAVWMARQAEEYRWHRKDLAREGVRIVAHGSGLIPDIDRQLRYEEAKA